MTLFCDISISNSRFYVWANCVMPFSVKYCTIDDPYMVSSEMMVITVSKVIHQSAQNRKIGRVIGLAGLVHRHLLRPIDTMSVYSTGISSLKT